MPPPPGPASDLAWLWRVVPEHPNLFFDTAWWAPADLLALFALVPPGQILHGSDAPYFDVELGLALTLRCARFAGLSQEAIALVAGGQLATLLAGDEPVDAGPPPDTPTPALSPSESRVASRLTAVGGAALAGGDPSELIELTLLAIEPSSAVGDMRATIPELIEEMRSSPETALLALAFALNIATTPGVANAAHTGALARTA